MIWAILGTQTFGFRTLSPSLPLHPCHGEVGQRFARGAVVRAPFPFFWGGRGCPHDRALIKWQSEDQSWLRNHAAKRPEQKTF